ncbi:MAG: phosphatidylglycerol lysyltransferase domain-containing protein [Desulfobacteraceae bacterium]|jgi:hypothetical protein
MTLEFEPIELERQQEYTGLLARCPQVVSDYSFLNLWAWAEDYGLRWAWEDNLVWIQQTHPQISYWAPVGAWQEIDWRARFVESPNNHTTFIRVPQTLAEGWRADLGDRVTTVEDRGHWDYVYSVDELVELKGNRYHKKKNLVNQFKKKYDYVYTPLEPDLIDLARGMQEDWCSWRDCESSEILSAENSAIYRVLRDWDLLEGTLGGALMMDQVMVAYTVAEALSDDMLLIHFEKGDVEYKGVYQAINQMFLAHSGVGFRFVNREQDLGDEGLRKAKLSYHPVDYLKKCRVDLPGNFISS